MKCDSKWLESLKSVQGMVVAELENGNFSMAAHEEEEQTKLEELKLLREMIKHFELELKGMKGIDPHRIAGAIVLFIFVICTVHRLNKQNAIVAELEEHKQSNANKFAELEEQKQSNANKFAELEGHQNQQQQNIDALTEAQKRNGRAIVV
uniref:Sensitive to high expression protein 9, mitochondrial n=1 Tax=Globodera pallida TaxID=36090 RepID=A0A183CSP4_GLOPA